MGLVQAVVVARVLGPRQFGTAVLIIGFTTLVFTFLDPRSEEAVVKYLSQFRATGRTEGALAVPKVAYATDAVLGLAGFSLVLFGADAVEDHLFKTSGTAHLLVLFAAASSFSGTTATSRAVLTTFRRFRTVAVIQASGSVVRTGLMVAMVLAGWGVDGVIYAAAAVIVAEAAVVGAVAHRSVRGELGAPWWRGRRRALGESFGEMVRFMVYTDFASLAGVFVKEADVVILGYVGGPTQAGYYRLARSAATPISGVVLPLQQVAYPRFSELVARRDYDELALTIRRYTFRLGVPLAAAASAAVPLVPLVLPVVAGSEFEAAVAPSMVLVAGEAFTLPLFWARPTLLAAGRVRYFFILSLVTAAVAVAGFVVLGDAFGATGTAVARAGIVGLAGSSVAAWHVIRSRRQGLFRTDEQEGPVLPCDDEVGHQVPGGEL